MDAIKATDERELKLSAGPRFHLPDLPGERLRPRVFTSTYVDTADHRLATAGVTLRRRVEAGRGRWQLKLPRGKSRLELEVADPPAGSRGRRRRRRPVAPDVPPASLVDLVTVYARGAPLVPAAILRTRREGVMVRDPRGPVAEVVIDSVQVRDGHRTTERFREIEVELTGGDEHALLDIEDRLRQAGAGDGDGRPKLLRALGIAPAPPPPPAEPAAAAPEQLRAALAAQVALLVATDPGTRLGEDPEALHQMRVACRRLRTMLREARAMLDADWVQGLRDEIEWLGDELGAVRDLDVLRQHLSDQIATLDPADARGGSRLIRALEAERGRVRHTLIAGLRSERYLRLLAALDEAARAPRIADGEASLVDAAAGAFKRVRRAAKALGDQPADEALHELRIKVKRARYAAEMVAATVGDPAERFIERAKELQDLLGDYQDAVVAQQRIRELAARARGAAAALEASPLLERQATRRAELRGQFPRRWSKLEKRGLKAWR